jgi:hypothetical protein
MRGSLAPVIRPKRLELKFVFGFPRFTRLRELKHSACVFCDECSLVYLRTAVLPEQSVFSIDIAALTREFQ